MDRWGINSWKDYRHILWGNIRPICMYTNPNCKYSNVKTRRRPCMAKLMAGWLFFFILFSGLGTAFKFWAQKTASRGDSCRCAEFWEASDLLWLLAKIPKEALHRGMYIPSSSNQCLDVLRIVNEIHFSELSKLCCIELLRRHWNEVIINDYKTKKQSLIYKHASFSVIVYTHHWNYLEHQGHLLIQARWACSSRCQG